MAGREETLDRTELAAMVSSSVAKLLKLRVIVLEVEIQSVRLQKELAKKCLKVKFKMDGTTRIKTATRNATADENGCSSIIFNTVGDAIFEGGENMSFELCASHRLSSSRALATCQFPLATALSVFPLATVLSVGGSSQVHKMRLRSISCPGKEVGELQIKIGIRTPTLQAAGGLGALRNIELAEMPELCMDRSAFAMANAKKECLFFVDKARKSLECLQVLLDENQIKLGASSCDLKGIGSDHDDVSTTYESKSSQATCYSIRTTTIPAINISLRCS
mmetsp:Transcript_33348/g.53081  ORF Transcript_33348/g.53081 Transcript_33348/m.53081 type:complete len:278 (-) Transcript_33348:94-927(-)